jgi:hypothetical protein
MHILYAGTGLHLPAHFSPINFPVGNAATGFFVIFAVIAGVVGAGSALAGLNHVRAWSTESLPAAASAGFIAWTLTLLAMGYVRTLRMSGPVDHRSTFVCVLLLFGPLIVDRFADPFPLLHWVGGRAVGLCRLAVKEIELHGRNARLVS